ncbi:MAG: NAD(+) synthase [Bacilli bacterium]
MYKNGYLKVEASTPHLITGNIKHNQKMILNVLNRSKAAVIVFPELTITGYPNNDLFFQESFLLHAKSALAQIMKQTTYQGVYIVGMPIDVAGILYNCAVIVQQNEVLGIVPKQFLPNHHEFSEKRWFKSGLETNINAIRFFNKDVPFGKLLFLEEDKNICFGVEVCQDLWAPYTPSDEMSLFGANIIFNLSASSEFVAKRQLRQSLIIDHSRKQMTAYVYTTTGNFESTSEVVYSAHKIIAVRGSIIAESPSFESEPSSLVADLDLTGINYHRRQDSSYRDMHLYDDSVYQMIQIKVEETNEFIFEKPLDKTPFIPKVDLETEIDVVKQIQAFALIKKIRSLPENLQKIMIGVSGGLDSALALSVANRAFRMMNKDVKDIIAVIMPSDVTSKESIDYANQIIDYYGVTKLNIPIQATLESHLNDIDHEAEDVTYENAQARIRTLVLMDLANKYEGIVLGTGNLSEIALGFMTYSGDQMSMYAINSGLPKTWVKLLIQTEADDNPAIKNVLENILKKPISPELIKGQETEKMIGLYEINDFILHHHLERGADKEKITWLVENAFRLPKKEAKEYADRFFKRFYTQQFKRQTMPEGPKVIGISLSPRGTYKLPSDIDYNDE